MTTKTYVFNGLGKWAKVRDFQKDEKYGHFGINVYLSAEELRKFENSGIRVEVKADEEGTFVTFKRRDEELIKGELKVNGPPDVYLKDDMSGEYNLWKTGLIGNGSQVAVTVDAFDTANGIGHRLQRVFVDHLIPYESKATVAPETAKLPF